jgi:hypothetical protein
MADLAIGQCIASSLDLAYFHYKAFWERIGITPASYEAWLRVERLGSGCALSKATGGIPDLTSYAESRKRMKKPPTLPIHSHSAPA